MCMYVRIHKYAASEMLVNCSDEVREGMAPEIYEGTSDVVVVYKYL